ncbi:MAG: hypothetical protein HPY58_11595 [Firmicutes bacterium]|nr:hypothetical protein [Bacillota bacterium]
MWRAYRVIFRLRSSLHIGLRKVGNLQRTRPYVTGRAFWGALTMRLTRDAAGAGPATESLRYKDIGEQINQNLAFTYFYPATQAGGDYQVAWPWEKENLFRRRFLSSYQGTALSAFHESAAIGMLREVEFISPYTLDTGEPVFLVGYIFESKGSKLAWREALTRVQFGGERGYGWGDVGLIRIDDVKDDVLFGGKAKFDGSAKQVRICVSASEPLLAHTLAVNLPAKGEVESLVGREWRSYNCLHRYAGQHVEFVGVCFTPGSVVDQDLNLVIGKFGIWRRTDGSS